MLNNNTLRTDTAVIGLLFLCQRVFLGLFLRSFAVFVILVNTLKPAVRLDFDVFDDLNTNGLFPHVEVMRSATLNKYSKNFMRFRVNNY